MGKGQREQKKGFILFISNNYIDDIIKIIQSLDDSSVLIDGVTETVKHEIKKQEGGFAGAVLAPLAASFVQPVVSSVVKDIAGRGLSVMSNFNYETSFNGIFFKKQFT